MTHPKVLMLGSIWPEVGASAASTRVLGIVDALLACGYHVTFSADAKEGPSSQDLEKRGVSCIRLLTNDPAFDAFVAELQPDITIFDRYTTEEKFSWRVRAQCPTSVRVLDTIDLHFVRHARTKAHAAGKDIRDWPTLLHFAGDIALREIAAIYRSDLSLIVSDEELSVLSTMAGVPLDLLHLYRLTYPIPPAKRTPFAERTGYIMIGSFRHPPNEDSVLWMKHELWPAIRRLQPNASIHIYGAHAQKKHLDLSAPAEGLHVMGYAADPLKLMAEKRVNLAPLRFGAGIKGKIADGWWSGTPVVTTAIGAEGMHGGLPFGGITAEKVDELALAAVALHDDASVWEAKSWASQTIIKQLYTPEVTELPFLARLQEQLATREALRLRNFTGQMLWQQTLRATEYFSRWIELKNAKT